MKKQYETPTVEKLAFRYRDQVVAASADESGATPPTIGGWTNAQGTDGCKWYVAEAWGINICHII